MHGSILREVGTNGNTASGLSGTRRIASLAWGNAEGPQISDYSPQAWLGGLLASNYWWIST